MLSREITCYVVIVYAKSRARTQTTAMAHKITYSVVTVRGTTRNGNTAVMARENTYFDIMIREIACCILVARM